jgi:hypothetical protein
MSDLKGLGKFSGEETGGRESEGGVSGEVGGESRKGSRNYETEVACA